MQTAPGSEKQNKRTGKQECLERVLYEQELRDLEVFKLVEIIQEISALELAMSTRDLVEHIRTILYLTKIKERLLMSP